MQSDTDKRAAAIAVLGGPETARVILTRTRDGVNRHVTEQERAICDLALHALDSDGAAMLRDLREWVDSVIDPLASMPRDARNPAQNGRLNAFLDMRDRLLDAKPAPEPAPAPQPAAEPSAAAEARIAEWLRQCQEHISSGAIPSTLETHGALSQAKTLMREFATRTTQVVHRRQVTQTGEHFCETQCEERKRLLARAEKVESDRNQWRDQVIGAREIVDAAPDESLEVACATLVARAEKAEAEVERLRGRDAEPFDWDAAPTVQEWIDENLPEKEPRAGIALVELHPDEVVADRGEARRAAGWLKDIMAEAADLRARLAAAEQQLAAAAKFPPGFVPEGCVREDDHALRDCLMTPLPDLVHGADSMRWLRIHSLGIKELCRRALAQEAGRA